MWAAPWATEPTKMAGERGTEMSFREMRMKRRTRSLDVDRESLMRSGRRRSQLPGQAGTMTRDVPCPSDHHAGFARRACDRCGELFSLKPVVAIERDERSCDGLRPNRRAAPCRGRDDDLDAIVELQ